MGSNSSNLMSTRAQLKTGTVSVPGGKLPRFLTTPRASTRRRSRSARQAGAALLAVLWLSAALAAIAFSLANTVRGETERASTSIEGLRAYYLATGAIERAILYIEWGQPYYTQGMPRLAFEFPSGHADVELIPETAKLNINTAPPEELFQLLLALGADPERAQQIAAAIQDWRTPEQINQPSAFDQYYLSLTPSFRPRHASLVEIEELLLVRAMTPDLFYGTYDRDAAGRLVARAGLRDCVSVLGSAGRIDINSAEPAVMSAIGVPSEAIAAILQMRRQAPFTQAQMQNLPQGAPGLSRLGIVDSDAMTLRASARLRLPDGSLSRQSRSVAALVVFNPVRGVDHEVIRWNDNVWVK